jgi:hypothetical protein
MGPPPLNPCALAQGIEQGRQEGIGVRQNIGVIDGLVRREPEDFVDFAWVGRGRRGREFRQPAPERARRVTKEVLPDTTYGDNVGVQFLLHFPHHRLSLAFTSLNPPSWKADAQWPSHGRTAANEQPASVRTPTGYHDAFRVCLDVSLYRLCHSCMSLCRTACLKGTRASTTACS